MVVKSQVKRTTVTNLKDFGQIIRRLNGVMFLAFELSQIGFLRPGHAIVVFLNKKCHSMLTLKKWYKCHIAEITLQWICIPSRINKDIIRNKHAHIHTHTHILTKDLLVEQTRKMDSNEFNFFFANKLQQLRIFLS